MRRRVKVHLARVDESYRLHRGRGTVMWSLLLLGTALAAAQAPPEPEAAQPVTVNAPLLPAEASKPAETPAAATPAPPAERWPLMKALQGTWPGWLLDGN